MQRFGIQKRFLSSKLNASLLLSRTPIVTPEIPAFEAAFYEYQEELERRLMWTFPKWYYFKKGTVAEREFTQAQTYPIPNNPSVWFPEGRPDLMHGRDRRFKEDVKLPKKHIENDEEIDLEDISRPIKPHSRITKADETNDQTSLERKLSNTLYLIVSSNGGQQWKLPTFEVDETNKGKGLHLIAEDGLRQLGGERINTWSVSNTPASVLKYNIDGKLNNTVGEADADTTTVAREYILKSHIIAGKFEPKDSATFKWLTKDELKTQLDAEYFSEIEPLLADY